MPIPRHSFRWTPKCVSHSIREWNANIIAVYNRPKLGLNVIAWSHYRSDPVQVQSTLIPGTLQLSRNYLQDTRMLIMRFGPKRLSIKRQHTIHRCPRAHLQISFRLGRNNYMLSGEFRQLPTVPSVPRYSHFASITECWVHIMHPQKFRKSH